MVIKKRFSKWLKEKRQKQKGREDNFPNSFLFFIL